MLNICVEYKNEWIILLSKSLNNNNDNKLVFCCEDFHYIWWKKIIEYCNNGKSNVNLEFLRFIWNILQKKKRYQIDNQVNQSQ